MPNAEAEVPPQQGDKKKKPEPFHLAEKIGEMVDYGYPLTMSFPRKDRELADELRRSMLAILRYSVEIDRRYFKKDHHAKYGRGAGRIEKVCPAGGE